MAVPFSFVVSDSGTITVWANGKPYPPFAKDNPVYAQVKKAIENRDAAAIERLSNIPQAIENYCQGNIRIEHGILLYSGKPLHTSLTKRILRLMSEGFPFEFMLRFLERLKKNTSKHAVEELYNFLVHRNLPITQDGCFLAYKAVRADYMDWHSGKIRNMVGDTPPPMERNEVDDDWRVQCSSGYHVGAIEYVQDFHRGEGHVMIVEVDPADVVSVPTDESFTKCRATFYKVVAEMDGELMAQVYRTAQNSYSPVYPSDPIPVAEPVSSFASEDSFPTEDDEYED